MMWSLYENGAKLKPLVFSNGKSQEDVVKEVIDSIKEGYRVIFIKGMCGTGKSAIALNLSREVGRASVVVPIKNLQKQYEEDYANKKYILKNDKKLNIKIITGRVNHLCPYLKENSQDFEFKKNSKLSDFENTGLKDSIERAQNRDVTCDNLQLPCKIQIKEKNIKKIREYLKENPKINTDFLNVSLNRVRRMSIAPICPYWSPVVPSEIELDLDGECKNYHGLNDRRFTIYQRKPGCGYYNQFESYINSDVIIFNSQKYKLETVMNRKPATDIEIIDECDEFLDSFSNSKKINFNRLNFALGSLFPENDKINEIINELLTLTKDALKDKKIEESISADRIFHIKETKIFEILKHFLDSSLMDYVECDEENYCYHIEEVARIFEGFFEETYVSFCKEEKDLIAKIITTNLEKRFKELLDKNKIIVMMSGTIHSEDVLKNIFGLSDFKIIEAETKIPGAITKKRTGFEIDCKYENLQRGEAVRKRYLKALSKCIESAEKPLLVHVSAFKDLPTEHEARLYGLSIITREKLRRLQGKGEVGEQVRKFKSGETDILYSTTCNRGVDFPGAMCNSIILTKYPYPNVSDLFWRILKKTKRQHYHSFYMDKARREFIQKICRGLRSEKDHVSLLSPDSRVLNFRIP